MTKYCIRCGKPAKFGGGHVLKGDTIKGSKKIIAGWCSKRCVEVPGFSGHWLPFMGVLAGLLLTVGVAQAEQIKDCAIWNDPELGVQMEGAGCIDEMDRAIKAVLSKYSSPCYQKMQEAMRAMVIDKTLFIRRQQAPTAELVARFDSVKAAIDAMNTWDRAYKECVE